MGQNSRESFSYRSHAERSSLYAHLKARHSGMDGRNLGYMDVYRLPSMALDTGFPAGMTVYLTFVITMSAELRNDVLFTLSRLHCPALSW